MTRLLILSVVPSPYQQDFLRALAARADLEIKVVYLEDECNGYPWPRRALAPWEDILPGFRIESRQVRIHVNRCLPEFGSYDLAIVNTYITAVTAQWATRVGLRGKKWMFWGERLRSQDPGWKHKVQHWLAAPLSKAAGIAAVGSVAQSDYSRRFPGMPVFNIPYHCDLTEFLAAPRPSRANGDITFLFCGVMNARKGVDLLLRAFDRLIRQGTSANLLLIGQEADLSTFLRQTSPAARARINYQGFRAPSELPKYFARADVFVLPSRYDGWGVVVNQALGAGLPIVCSDAVGAGQDLVTLEQNGLRFPTGNEESLFASLKRFVDAPALCSEWGANSRAKAMVWSPEAGAQKMGEAIREVLHRNQ